MPAATLEEFLDALRKSNLLNTEELAGAERNGSPGLPAESFARQLISQGLLTRWQAQQLLAGRHTFFLGRYQLQERLGHGKYGVVFKAKQTDFGRTVALKIMSPAAMAHPRAAARFEREIRLAASVNHPNIVAAFDAESVGDTHFLVMEYVEGKDLKTWLNDFGRLPIDWSCEVIAQAALGLEHVHQQGLVHRDIKPGNLIITAADTSARPLVKLLDLGLARVVTSDNDDDPDRITKTGHVLGTIDYISPEQVENTKTVDIRGDIYSLGCTLFKCLTGQVPFEGKTLPEKVMGRLKGDAPRVSVSRPDVPMGLDSVIAKMLARDPADRYQRPAEVAVALAPYRMIELEQTGGLDGSSANVSLSDKDRIALLEKAMTALTKRVAELEGGKK